MIILPEALTLPWLSSCLVHPQPRHPPLWWISLYHTNWLGMSRKFPLIRKARNIAAYHSFSRQLLLSDPHRHSTNRCSLQRAWGHLRIQESALVQGSWNSLREISHNYPACPPKKWNPNPLSLLHDHITHNDYILTDRHFY